MRNLLFKRFVIIITFLAILLGLEAASEETLFLNLPTEYDVITALLQQKAQEQQLLDLKNQYFEDQLDIVEEYQEEMNIIEERLFLEQQRIEEERLKEIEDAQKNAYTLGNRDKAQDYQKLFTDSIKHTFIIDFDTLEWEGLINDMEAYNDLYGTYKSNNYRKVDVTYFADNEKIYIQDVGIRSKGNIFSRYPPEDEWGNVRPIHYVLKFNETFDTTPGTQQYDWLKKREVFDLENLIFKWNRNYDPTYISEVYSYRLFKEAGVVVPEISLAKFVIKIDGVVVMEELYTVQESMDEEFIRKHLQDQPTKEVGDLYKVTWPGTLEPIYNMDLVGIRNWEINYRPVYGKETNSDVYNFTNLVGFTRQLGTLNGVALQQYLVTNMDVDSYLRVLAASVLLGNPDDYRGNANNYYLYFDEEDNMTFIPFDFDHSLGQGWDGSPVFINYTIGNDIYTWQGAGFNEYTDNVPLADKILEFENYQILYEDYIEGLIDDGYFTYAHFTDLFDTFESVYGNEFDMSNNKLWYFVGKTAAVTEDINFYRNQRD